LVVGVATIELYLHGVQSLKQKRSIVRKVVHRVRNQFEISVAEVDLQDVHQSAAIGCAIVTNDARLANSVLSKVIDHITSLHLAEVSRAGIEILHV
jgi:uncharacterized protein YlxP (DUF503 family)